MPRLVRLAPGREKPVLAGHPWIFSGALAGEPQGDAPPDSDWVLVCDHRGHPLGDALLSPASAIRLRMIGAGESLFQGHPSPDDERALWTQRLDDALARRRREGIDTAPGSAFRALNSEGDGVPGVIVDVFGPALVLQLSTAPMARRRDLWIDVLRSRLNPRYILQADPDRLARLEGFEPARGWLDEAPAEPITFLEGDVPFALAPEQLQKTGHYLDVREHHRWVAQRAAGASVFDGYCFTGGFALHAARAGAASVLAVDSSEPAIQQARLNQTLAAPDADITWACGDVRDLLRSSYDRGRRFDIVILDPPKLAPKKQDREGALKLYTALIGEGLRVLSPGGLFGISSCSHHVTEDDLVRATAFACARTGRLLDVVHTAGQPADHPWPVAMSEGRYLAFVFARAR